MENIIYKLGWLDSLEFLHLLVESNLRPASTTIGNPTTLAGLGLFHTKILDGSTLHTIVMGTFTNSQSYCGISTFEIYESDGTTVHASLDKIVSGYAVTIRLKSPLVSTKGTYPFKLKATAQGGREFWANIGNDPLFTMDVVCGPSSTVLSESTYTVSSLTD